MTRPAGRPAASSSTSLDPPAHGALPRFSSSTLPVTPSRQYITPTRLRSISDELSARDRAVLVFVSETRLTTGRQLARRFWAASPDGDSPEARAARRTLGRLAQSQVLTPLPRRIGGPRAGSSGIVYGVGTAGLKLLARSGFHARRLSAPGAMFTDHTLAIAETVVELHEADRAGELELIAVQTEPTCWRGFVAVGGAAVHLKPDLFVRIGAAGASEDCWMIEVDRSTEGSGALRVKAERHLAYWGSGQEPTHPRVLWAVPDEQRVSQLTHVLRPLPDPADRLFAICLATQTTAFLATEARR